MASLVFLTLDSSSRITSSHHVPTLPLAPTCTSQQANIS